MQTVKFYHETFIAAARFCDTHGIPAAAIQKFRCGRCETSVPAEWAAEIRHAI